MAAIFYLMFNPDMIQNGLHYVDSPAVLDLMAPHSIIYKIKNVFLRKLERLIIVYVVFQTMKSEMCEFFIIFTFHTQSRNKFFFLWVSQKSECIFRSTTFCFFYRWKEAIGFSKLLYTLKNKMVAAQICLCGFGHYFVCSPSGKGCTDLDEFVSVLYKRQKAIIIGFEQSVVRFL